MPTENDKYLLKMYTSDLQYLKAQRKNKKNVNNQKFFFFSFPMKIYFFQYNKSAR